MNYYDFIKEIKEEDIGTTYLFTGEEEYLMNQALENLKHKYINDTFEAINFIRIDERNLNLESIRNACETLPFMSPKKIVLIKDTYKLVENQNLSHEDQFYKYLNSLGDHTILIMMDNDSQLNKSTKLYKFLKKKNLVINFDKLRGSNLSQWIIQILRKNEKTISNANINYLIQESSYLSKNINVNLYALENALVKLVDSSKNKEISKADIDSILVKRVDTNIFELLNAINRFDAEAGLRELNEMYMANEHPTKILHMIIRRIRLILSYKLYLDKGYSRMDIQGKLQIKDYEFRIIGGQIGNFTKEMLIEFMNKILDIDIKIKTTSINEGLLLEMLIVELCNK